MEQLVDGQVEVEYEVAQEKPVGGWVGGWGHARAEGTAEKRKGATKNNRKGSLNALITNCSGSRSERLATLLLRQTFLNLITRVERLV